MAAQSLFQFQGCSIRAISQNNQAWFVAKDVAIALGYKNTNKAIGDHCKHAQLLKGNDSLPLEIPHRGITIIPEPDVYRLVSRSKLPEAEKFTDWLYEEVIPTIRKTGSYHIGEQEPLITAEEREILRVATVSFTRHFPYFQSKATSHLHRTLKKRYNLTKWELMPKKLLPTVLADVRSLDRQAHYLTQYIWKLEFAFLFWVLKPEHDPQDLTKALNEQATLMLNGVKHQRAMPHDPRAGEVYR